MLVGKLLHAIFAICLSVTVTSGAAAAMREVDTITDGILNPGEILRADFYMTESMDIINMGMISENATIYVCDGCELRFHSRGPDSIFDGNIVLGYGATLVQVIENADDINIPYFNVDYNILVNSRDKLSLDDIVDVMDTAGKIILQNASVSITNIDAMRDVHFEIVDSVKIYLSDMSMLESGNLLEHVSGNGSVSIYVDGMDSMYVLNGKVENGELNVEYARNTNYREILPDVRGTFLDWLRVYNPDDKLLKKLDSARNMNELESIMARSARLNPINLMNPVRLLNLTVQNDAHFTDNETGAFAAPLMIFSNDADFYGATLGVFGRITDRLSLAITGYMADADYSDDINDFNATMFGANIAVNYDVDIVFVRAMMGGTYSEFDSGPVLNGTDIKFNPNGLSFYGFADIGHKFDFSSIINVAPFVGVGFERDNVLDKSAEDFFVRFGTDAGISIKGDDLHYNYGVRITADTIGDVTATLRASVFSPIDAAGGEISVGYVGRDDMHGISLTIGTRIVF